MNETTYDPITKKEYTIKKQIRTNHCIISFIYNKEDINQEKYNEIIGNTLYNQAVE
jgi:hypothetical protein